MMSKATPPRLRLMAAPSGEKPYQGLEPVLSIARAQITQQAQR